MVKPKGQIYAAWPNNHLKSLDILNTNYLDTHTPRSLKKLSVKDFNDFLELHANMHSALKPVFRFVPQFFNFDAFTHYKLCQILMNLIC